ncbi:hypothetical protein MLD38_034744 [Melastoma candidum]|uniref:Uncharacterized protein n=1 Tax=Melastoma candidum TaxID=119954 RepID=A0ACB9MET5_9MYRT|nr:hypothetical protein MLD38_034744 [Melastoma candidum]
MISSSGKLNKRLVLSPEGRTRSWLSHLPDEVKYKRVVGHGITAQEFARNPRLDYFFCEGYEQGSAVEIQSNSLDVVQQRAVPSTAGKWCSLRDGTAYGRTQLVRVFMEPETICRMPAAD